VIAARVRSFAAALAVVALLPACGTSGAAQGKGSSSVSLTVLAAASLKSVFPRIGRLFEATRPGVKISFSFGGTDALAAQIEQGAPADVFAGASATFGDQLAAKRLIDPYRLFCTNRLVLVVPPSNPAGVASLQDLTRKGVKLVIGDPSVPVGSYTRTVLHDLDATYGAGFAKRVLANVVSNELDVGGVLTKVESGEADAGFVYVTDAASAGPAVRTIALPDSAQAVAQYPIAVVHTSLHREEAARFVAFVLGAQGQQVLKAAGFGPPPSR
jgi:molybdate transport system substrate-binding protein